MINETMSSPHSKANVKPTENEKAAPEATAIKIYKEKLKWHDAVNKERKFYWVKLKCPLVRVMELIST